MQRAAYRRASDPVRPASVSRGGDRRATLEALRTQIAALEGDGSGALRPARPRLEAPAEQTKAANDTQSGCDALAVFRAQAGLHDVRPGAYLDAPAAYAFAARWMAGWPGERAIVWVRARGEARLDFGTPCPDGLARAGIDPARMLRIDARPGADALWAMEEALNAGALVFGEAGSAKTYDLTASRRLHRAARAAGGQILVLRAHDANGTSAALTRWAASPAPGRAAPWRGAGGLPGLGGQKIKAVLERRRGGAPDVIELEWDDDALRSLEPAALADRPVDAAAG